MLKIYYTRYSTQLPKSLFEHYLSLVSDACREKIFKYRRWQDQQNTLFGRILLLRMLNVFGFTFERLPPLKFGDSRRPYLNELVDFSISHSETTVVCAMSDEGKVGIDVEVIREVDILDFKNVFCDEEINRMHSTDDVSKLFYEIWTEKESVVKADGRGLRIPLRSVRTTGLGTCMVDSNLWFVYKPVLNEDCCLHLAVSRQPIEPLVPFQLQLV